MCVRVYIYIYIYICIRLWVRVCGRGGMMNNNLKTSNPSYVKICDQINVGGCLNNWICF